LKGKPSGKVYERARLDRRGDDVPSDGIAALGKRGLDRFTRWDWVVWWIERGSDDYVRCFARERSAEDSGSHQRMAVLAAQYIPRSLLCTSARIGFQDWADV